MSVPRPSCLRTAGYRVGDVAITISCTRSRYLKFLTFFVVCDSRSVWRVVRAAAFGLRSPHVDDAQSKSRALSEAIICDIFHCLYWTHPCQGFRVVVPQSRFHSHYKSDLVQRRGCCHSLSKCRMASGYDLWDSFQLQPCGEELGCDGDSTRDVWSNELYLDRERGT